MKFTSLNIKYQEQWPTLYSYGSHVAVVEYKRYNFLTKNTKNTKERILRKNIKNIVLMSISH
jgi:hypothetical protein